MSKAREIGSCFSRLYNVIRGGTADLSFSARSHRDGLREEAWIDWFFYIVFGEENHCKTWWEYDVKRAYQTIDYAKGMTDERTNTSDTGVPLHADP